MNAAQVLANLSTADRQALLEILNQREVQEAEQNDFPAVADQVWSKKVRQRPGSKEWYAADGKPIANNPRQFGGYVKSAFPRALYRLSEKTFETVLVDPKTAEEKPVRKTTKSKQAADALRAAGWKPSLESIIAQDELACQKYLKAGWIESPETLKPVEDEDEHLISLAR